MRFFRRRKPAPEPQAEFAGKPEPKQFDCKFCGSVFGVPAEHLETPEHKMAQAQALSPMARRAEIDAMRETHD